MPRGAAVVRYRAKHGLVFRIKYIDGGGRQVMETVGAARDGITERSAKKVLRERLVDVDRDGLRKPEALTFAQFADRWLAEYLPARNLKPTTVINYRTSIRRHLRPFFGDRTLFELETRPELVDRYIAAKMQQTLAPKTIANTLGDLNVMLKQAVRWRLMRTNPVLGAERPRLEPKEMNVLTEAEIAKLRAAYHELEADAEETEREWWSVARTITFFALGTAMRRGELLALRWRDVRMLEGMVTVREAYVRGQFTTPKSRSSRRMIELGPQTKELLAEHWARTAFKGDDELVFAHPKKGTPLDPSKLSRMFMRKALIYAGVVKPFRCWHDLRHTSITHEAAAGNPHAYVQMRAGHSQSSITDKYIHAAQVLFPGAAARAEARMFGVLETASETPPKAEGVETG